MSRRAWLWPTWSNNMVQCATGQWHLAMPWGPWVHHRAPSRYVSTHSCPLRHLLVHLPCARRVARRCPP